MQHKFIFCRTNLNHVIIHWKKAFFPVFFLCAIVCSGAFASALQAAEFAGGDGTDNNPWKIKTREHLSSLTNYIGTAGVGKFFRLENDITFAEEDFAPGGAFYNNGAGWVPVGHRRVSNRMFSGNFDGRGYAIRNLVIHRPTSADVGFFGFTKSATISNLRIEGVFLNGATNVAALAGADESSLFSNCSASGTVNGMKTVAGLVGYTQEGVFLRCGASCTVSASLISTGFTDISAAGGMLAYAENVSLDECYALGSLSCATSAYAGNTSGTAYAGGLVGYLHSSTVSSSMAKGSVTLSTADADFSGDGYAGGLIGYMHISSVEDSYATGHVSANTVPKGQSIPIPSMGKGYIGGVCGFSLSSSVSRSYALGACSVTSGNTSAYAGGIVGASSFSQISSSVALNNSIQCNSDTFSIESHAGRIEAVNAAAFSKNLATTSLILKANNSVLTPVDDLDGKDGGSTSPEVLKTTLPYESLGWDLTTVWDYTAVDYPVLAWEKEIFVTQAPKIISQPQSLNVIEGQEAVFEVTATGGALSYVWTHNGKVIRDETQPRLVIENAQISNQGVYVVTVSNSKGSVESSPATLTIVNVPSITEHPQNKDLNPGDLLDLSVTATGTPPLYYQWYKDGELVPDATSPQFTVASVTETDAGSYTVVVSNAVGSVTSNPAKVTVKEEPPVTEIYLFNPLLILEGGKLYLVFEVKGAAIFNVEGSIDGEHWFDAAYTLTGEGKVKILASQQYVFYRAIAEGTPVDIAPEITSSPQNVELFVGDKLDLSVTATGTPPLNYQWYKDGEPIPGAALPQLTIPSVTEVDAGVYTVVVSNTAGSATSNPARVNVYVLPLDEAILLNPTIKDGYFYFYLDIPVWVTQEMIQVWHKTPNADWVIEKNASIDITRNEVLVPRLPGSALYKVVIVGPP